MRRRAKRGLGGRTSRFHGRLFELSRCQSEKEVVVREEEEGSRERKGQEEWGRQSIVRQVKEGGSVPGAYCGASKSVNFPLEF